MRNIYTILIFTLLFCLTSCDPVHDLQLQNQTNKTIEVIFYPSLDNERLNNKRVKEFEYRGHIASLLTLDTAETIKIGHVFARYNPKADDIAINYLEIRFDADTIKLTGKNAILSTLQQLDKLDWRLIIKKK